MPRPKSKEELKLESEKNYNKLIILINSLSEEDQHKSFCFEDRDKNIRDVVVHLYEWHQLLLNWVTCNQAGIKVNFLPEPYNWKKIPEMNVMLWEKHQKTPLHKALAILNDSHLETMNLIDTFQNEELFTKEYFPWTGTTSLGSYSVSATSSHYDWAMKKIRKHKKSI